MSNPISSIHILVVDDEPGIRELLAYELGAKGYRVSTASNGQEALEKLSQQKFRLIISDVKMPKLGGVEFLDAVKKTSPEIEVILATGFGTVETAVDAMKKGAFDFLQKPFNLVDMFSAVEKALDRSELKTLMGVYEVSKMVFSSEKLEVLLSQIASLCQKSVNADDVLIFLSDATPGTRSVAVGSVEQKDVDLRINICKQLIVQTQSWDTPILIPDSLNKDSRLSHVQGADKIKSAIFYPLIVESQFFGVFNVNRTSISKPFSSSDLLSIPIYGAQVAQVLHNARMYDQLDNKIGELQTTFQKLENTQQQLVESDKLATLGKMVAGVIHDLNNPLNGILLSAQMFMDNEGLTEEQKEGLDIIVSQSKHCNEVIQNILQFSRKKEGKPESLNIATSIDSTLKLLRYDLAQAQIKVETQIKENLPSIYVDPTHLQQVFINLVTNAKQAMKDSSNKKILIKAEADSDFVQIKISDTGCGIPPENVKKIFEPFFTTKVEGEGTGLGLSICKELIEGMKGSLEVESQIDVGKTFKISLPIKVNKEASL